MTNVMIGWQNNISAAALTANSEAAGLGVGNLQTDQGAASMAWQTAAGATTGIVTVDTGYTASIWRVFLLARTNLSATATIRWRVGSDPTFSTGVVMDSGTIPANVAAGVGQTLYVSGANVVGRYARCAIVDTANPDGFLNIALAYAGLAWQPTSNISFATTRGRDDSTAETTTRGGQEFPVVSWRRRRWELDFQGIRNSEVAPYLDALDYAARAGGNVLVVPDPASSALNQEATFGRLKPRADLSYAGGAPDRRAWKATVTERL